MTSSATCRRAERRWGALARRTRHVLDLGSPRKCTASALRRRTSWIPTFPTVHADTPACAAYYSATRLSTMPLDTEASALLRTYRCLFFFAACTWQMHFVALVIRLVLHRSQLTLQNIVMKRHGLLEDVKMYRRWWSTIRSYIATCMPYFDCLYGITTCYQVTVIDLYRYGYCSMIWETSRMCTIPASSPDASVFPSGENTM